MKNKEDEPMQIEALIIDDVVDLNSLPSTGSIPCPYCGKASSVMYGTKGLASNRCEKCHRIVLWDYDNYTAYKASARKFAS
jgi:hypothetical protein